MTNVISYMNHYPIIAESRNFSIFQRRNDVLKFDSVIFNGESLFLNKPLICLWRKEGGFFFIENDYLDIYAYGSSLQEAIEDFYDCLFFSWKQYGLSNDKNPLPLVIKKKRRLMEFFNGRL